MGSLGVTATQHLREGSHRDNEGGEEHNGEPSIEDIKSRYEFLLQEMQEFAQKFKSEIIGDSTEAMGGLNKQLLGPVRKDLESINSLIEAGEADPTLLARKSHQLRSCNIPFDEALWALAKQSKDINAFRKRFPIRKVNGAKQKQGSAIVDIVANNGLDWVKICTTSERRMIFDMAKLGWSADSDDDDFSTSPELESGDDDEIPILGHAKDLSRAARSSRVNGRHPRVRVVFTRMRKGRIPQFDKIFSSIQALPYMSIEFAEKIDPRTPPVEQVVSTMVSNQFSNVTNILNLDCTTLLSLVSDLSHASVTERVWSQTQTKRQMENEIKEPILEKWLYPVLGGKRLVCTEMCRDQFWKIVSDIGTAMERARAIVLVDLRHSGGGDGHGDDIRNGMSLLSLNGRSKEKAINPVVNWRGLSNHPVPENLQLPVTVPSKTSSNTSTSPSNMLTKILEPLTKTLTPLNASIFLDGWHQGYTTITSNIIVVNKIRDSLERHLDTDEEIDGPSIWCRAPPRSLLAKEKQSVFGVECPPQSRLKGTEYKTVDGNEALAKDETTKSQA